MARTQPHDALFKAAFSIPAHAAAHLRTVLPPDLAARIDLGSLEIVPGSFVDDDLRSRHSDILYRARAGSRTIFIYVLEEHQSRVERFMVARLLGYEQRIWDDFRRKNPKAKKLPAILPVVVYHGATRWHAPTAFEEVIDLDGEGSALFAPYVPRFRFVLDDLTVASDESLRARPMSAFGRLVLWFLKHAREPEVILRELEAWSGVVRELLRAPNGRAAFELLLRYIFEVRPEVPPGELPALIGKSVGREAEETTMNALERWLDEGSKKARKEGRVEGRVEGQREVLLSQLVAKFGALPAPVAARVREASPADLSAWTLRVLTATSLAEVFAEPKAKPRARR